MDSPKLDIKNYKITRNKDKLATPNCRLHKVNINFIGQDVMFYNSILENIQAPSIKRFKKLVQKCLYDKAYYTKWE